MGEPVVLAVLEDDEHGTGTNIYVNGKLIAHTNASETTLTCLFHRRITLRDVGSAVEEVLAVICAADMPVPRSGPVAAHDLQRLIADEVPQLLQGVDEVGIWMSDGAVVRVELVAGEMRG